MTVEDVRSGRWARWDALRQESQESTTRDSGIETGSCFTSSEDSNRGDHIGKKVERPLSHAPKSLVNEKSDLGLIKLTSASGRGYTEKNC